MGILKTINKLKGRIQGNGLIKFLMRVFQEFGDDDGSTMAAGISYYIFLSAFPLILALIGLVGFFLPSASVQDQLFAFFRNNIPGSVDVLQNNIQQVINYRGTLGIVGIIGLLWSGSGAMGAVSHAINRSWDITRELQFYLNIPRNIGLTIGIGLLFFLSLGSSVIFNFIPVQNIPIIGAALLQIGIRIISFFLAWAVFLILFKIIPNTKTYWRHIWFGTLVTAILFEAGRTLAFFYLNNFSNYKLVYGSIASVILLLVWIYYSAIIFIIGAELTSEYGRLRRGISRGIHSHSVARPVEK
jgi:membrane protein